MPTIKTELTVPQFDFHKLPQKISAEFNHAKMEKLSDSSKPNPLLFNPTLLAQMYAINTMLPSLGLNQPGEHCKDLTIPGWLV